MKQYKKHIKISKQNSTNQENTTTNHKNPQISQENVKCS